MIYLESSALAKLVLEEAESEALRSWLADRSELPRVTSALSRVETPRAVMRTRPESLLKVASVLRSMWKVPLSNQLLDHAAELQPAGLRPLDAIHMATTLRVGEHLTAVISYDDRLLDAVKAHGLPAASPT